MPYFSVGIFRLEFTSERTFYKIPPSIPKISSRLFCLLSCRSRTLSVSREKTISFTKSIQVLSNEPLSEYGSTNNPSSFLQNRPIARWKFLRGGSRQLLETRGTYTRAAESRMRATQSVL